jgi:hypothetical protein
MYFASVIYLNSVNQLTFVVVKSHNTPVEGQGGTMYSSYSFLTWALDVVSGQRHAPAALYPRYPWECPLEPLLKLGVPWVEEGGWALTCTETYSERFVF